MCNYYVSLKARSTSSPFWTSQWNKSIENKIVTDVLKETSQQTTAKALILILSLLLSRANTHSRNTRPLILLRN